MDGFLFMFCSRIKSSISLDIRFLLGGIWFFGAFLDNSSTFLNLGFGEILNERSYEVIISAISIIRRFLLEVIYFWALLSITKISETFNLLIEFFSFLYLMQIWRTAFQICWCSLIKWYFWNCGVWWIWWLQMNYSVNLKCKLWYF